MSSEKTRYELSRRKVLAGLGTVGVASAGAGLGTSAYFSDTESFDGNTMTAGTLDLKIDWQQTYYGEIAWENDLETGIPINAYPDTDGDGQQDFNGVTYGGPEADNASIANIPGACCTCTDDEYLLVYGDQSWCIDAIERDQTIEEFYDYSADTDFSGNPEFADEDTSTVFLYRNTGNGNLYLVLIHDSPDTDDGGLADVRVWGLDGSSPSWVVRDDANQPEDNSRDLYVDDPPSAEWIWADEHTDGGAVGTLPDEFTMMVDLAFGDAAAAQGDNEETAFDDPASIRKLRVFDGSVDNSIVLEGPDGTPDNDDDLLGDVGPMTFSTDCSIESGADLPEDVFSAPNRAEMYGGPNEGQEHLIELDDIKPGDWGELTFSIHLCDNDGYVWMDLLNAEMSEGRLTEPEEVAENEIGESVGLAERTNVTLWYDDDCDNELDEDESAFWSGTLYELLNSAGEGIEDADGTGRRVSLHDKLPESVRNDKGCLLGDSGVCIGMKWNVPAETGNEIQDDSVGFDIRFYTEQCRHNDLDGGVPSVTGSGWGKLEESLNTPLGITSRARHGDGGWEMNIGSGDTPTEDPADVNWSLPIEDESWSLTYDSSDGSTEFTVGGTTVSRTTNASDIDGKLLVQTKADEATVDVQNVALSVGGSSQAIDGPTSVTASNDDDVVGDRALEYLVVESALDGSQDFELSGTLSVSTNDNFGGGDEDWAVDVSAE